MSDESYRRNSKHHFSTHELPSKLSQKAVLNLIGASSISEALDWLMSKRPAELREMFESIYKSSTKSQNKRWLQRRLCEALRLRPSQYFPLSNKATGKNQLTKAASYNPSSSSAALSAPSNSGTAVPVRKSTRIPKLRAFARLASTEPCTPTAAEVETNYAGRSFVEESVEEGNDDSETAVASLDSRKNNHIANSTGGVGDGFTSGISPVPASPQFAPTAAALVPPALAPVPPLNAAAAYKLLMKTGPGARTKDSAAEVAAIVAAKKRLKAFLPGYPLQDAVAEQQAAVINLFQPHYESSKSQFINAPILPAFVEQYQPTAFNSLEQGSIIITSGGCISGNPITIGNGNGIAAQKEEVEEEDDEIFMNLDPALVDMDMSLLPDGRMW